MKNDLGFEGREVSTDAPNGRERFEGAWQSRKPDLEVDGWEPSLLHRLLKYLDPKSK